MFTKIRRARMERGLTQVQFSQMLGFSQSIVSEIESGRRVATPRYRKEICREIGADEKDLFRENGLASK